MIDPNWDKRTLIWWSEGRQLQLWLAWQAWIVEEYWRLTCKCFVEDVEVPKNYLPSALGGLHACVVGEVPPATSNRRKPAPLKEGT